MYTTSHGYQNFPMQVSLWEILCRLLNYFTYQLVFLLAYIREMPLASVFNFQIPVFFPCDVCSFFYRTECCFLILTAQVERVATYSLFLNEIILFSSFFSDSFQSN